MKKLRRQSKQPLPKLKRKADRQLQDFFREKYPNQKCLVCGKRAELQHHFIEKSLSAGLRFELNNLIPLCHSCHFRHHQVGDSQIVAVILRKKGQKWADNLNKLRILRKGWRLDRQFLEDQLKRWAMEAV